MLRFLAAAACAALISTIPATAATFLYDGVVVSVSAASDATYPALGTSGTVVIEVDDSDPTVLLNPTPGMSSPVIAASVSVPGFFSGSLPFGSAFSGESISPTMTGFTYGSAYGPVTVDNPGTGPGFFSTGLHFVEFTFGSAVTTPSTVGDLVAAMSAPGASGRFNFEADLLGGGFDFVDVDFAASEVPLPAGGALLLTGLVGLGWLRRRR